MVDEKGCCVALTGIIWDDDRQIVQMYQVIMNNDKNNPRTKIVIEDFLDKAVSI